MKNIKRVCIIDDDPVYVFGTKRIMEKANFCSEFSIFHNPEIALNNLSLALEHKTELPEIILLDINMPILDGWQLLEGLLKFEHLNKILIYVVSSSIAQEDLLHVKRFPLVKAYLSKPLTYDVLNAMEEQFKKFQGEQK
jgi:CheY-like chemotaxis protein